MANTMTDGTIHGTSQRVGPFSVRWQTLRSVLSLLVRSYQCLLRIGRSGIAEQNYMFVVVTFALDTQVHRFRDPFHMIVRWDLKVRLNSDRSLWQTRGDLR